MHTRRAMNRASPDITDRTFIELAEISREMRVASTPLAKLHPYSAGQGRRRKWDVLRPLGDLRMKKVLLSAAGLAVLASPAFAADLPARTTYPVKAPAMVAPVYDWSGFYVGINGGGGWNSNCWTETSF